MNHRWYGVGVLLAVLVVLTLSAPAIAAAKQVPFKGRSIGVATLVDEAAGLIRVEGQGQATHLGRFTQTALVGPDVETGGSRGTWTLTAANGDMLFLEMTAIGIDDTHGIGTFTVVGGTGRFAGASGSYEQRITFGVAPGTPEASPFTDELTGTISY